LDPTGVPPISPPPTGVWRSEAGPEVSGDGEHGENRDEGAEHVRERSPQPIQAKRLARRQHDDGRDRGRESADRIH
jgi:hypothetical protein